MIDDVTIHDVLVQYEARVSELQNGLVQARFHSGIFAVALAISTAVFLVVGVYAIRHQVSLLWPSLLVPFAAFSAQRFRNSRQSKHRT